VAANNIMGRMSLSSSSSSSYTQYERMEFTQCNKIAENKR
jgi:roadblock/LC7 domain-containing protein